MNGRNEQDRRRLVMLYSIGFALLAICSILSLRLGAVATPFHEIWSDLRAGEGLVFDYRMPRLLAAIMVGMNLAVAGSMMQSITRNPMAAPDLIGINAGAGLVIVCLILIVPSFSAFTLPVAAFAGAAAAGGLVYLLAYQKSGTSHGRLVLSGLAVGGGLQALITFILVKYAPDASQALIFLKGSFYARSWLHVEMLLPWTLVCVPLAFLSSRYLSALQLGEDTVAGLGIRADRARLLLLGLVVALAGSSVFMSSRGSPPAAFNASFAWPPRTPGPRPGACARQRSGRSWETHREACEIARGIRAPGWPRSS